MNLSTKRLATTSIIVVFLSLICLFGYVLNKDKSFFLGLDLAGGAQLTYFADTKGVPNEEIEDRLSALQRVIERRVNSLGVSEPRVYTSSFFALAGITDAKKLIVELPGVSDIEEAIKAIGETPYLEFMLLNERTNLFESTGLQGGSVVSADVSFAQGPGGSLLNDPVVLLNFNSDGSKLFADITRNNVGEILGIFLDGVAISTPVILSPTLGGTTQISGNFSLEEAQQLAESLNFGALPIPISLEETRTVNPTLGEMVIDDSVFSAVLSFIFLFFLFVIVYRFVGIVAMFSILIYSIIVLSLFKLFPVVLTAAGLAGFIISIGFAVDANVLMFERMREEIKTGKDLATSIENGANRAWVAIRDANITSIIIAFLLFWFGTSIVKGFAFSFMVGVVVSMISAYLFTRMFLRLSSRIFKNKISKWYIW